MTCQQLMKSVGIKTITEMVSRTGLSRQMCHLLWHGNQRAGRDAAQAISDGTGLPLGTIFAVINGPPKKTKRKRKRS